MEFSSSVLLRGLLFMKQKNLRYIPLFQFEGYEGYKIFISVLFGLLGFILSFHPIQFDYVNTKIIINWSLIFPLLVAMAWGKRYGCISIIWGLMIFHTFIYARYNGWACLVSVFSLYIWIMLLGYSAEERPKVRKFYTNIYFLQFIYMIIRLLLYFIAFPFLYRFNPPFWYPAANTTIGYGTIAVFAFKNIIFEFIILAVCDVLLLLPFVRKIFRLESSKSARYNTGIVLGVASVGILFALIIMTNNYYIADGQHSFKWLFHPSAKIIMTLSLAGLFSMIFGGILARIFQWQLETKENLKVSEAKYRSIYENINDLYTEVTMDGMILTVSPSVKEVIGYEADDLIGTNISNLYSNPEERIEVFKTILLKKEIKNYEVTIKDKKGHKHCIWIHAKTVEHGDGQKKIISVMRDVTQYMEAREKQEESEKNYKLLFDKMLNGFFAIEPVFDENQKLQDIRFVDTNPAFEKYSGKKAGEVLGKTWSEAYGFRNRYLEVYEKVFMTGLPQAYEAYNPDLKHQSYLANAFMINENKVGVIFDNITDRVKAEEELKRINANLEAIIESTNDLIWLVDRDFKIILHNSAFANHLQKYFEVDKVLGIGPDEIFINDYTLAWNLYYDGVLKEGRYSTELLSPASGMYLDISFNPIYKDGEVLAISCFAKDITQRKLAEQEIFKFNAELEQRVVERTAELQMVVSELEAFTYTVSHDLKSPLRAIDAYSRIMLEDYPQQMEGEMEEIAGNIKNISRDMIALINKLLQYSTTTRIDIYQESVEISEMISMIFNKLVSSLPERQIKLIMETQLPQVKADKILLKQVIYNVISNAIKFTKARDMAVIKVGHTIDKEEIVFYIKDNGVGFDMESSGKLFGIFQRLHSLDEYEGTGIGLATVRKIMQRHGGRTWIEGKMNHGATVYFTLPLIQEQLPEASSKNI